MTAQIHDTVFFDNNIYDLIGGDESKLASPEMFGMRAQMIHTACYRGCIFRYEISEGLLVLREMVIMTADGKYEPICGIEPEIMKDYEEVGKETFDGATIITMHGGPYPGAAEYKGLSVNIPFTGKLRIARDFIQDMYIHMGFQKPSAYATVIDIVFHAGKVAEIIDRSAETEKIRGAFKKKYKKNGLEVIEDAFSLDLDLDLD